MLTYTSFQKRVDGNWLINNREFNSCDNCTAGKRGSYKRSFRLFYLTAFFLTM